MRIILTWIVAFGLTFLLAATWYITQPLLVHTSNLAEGITESGDWNTTGSGQMYDMLRLGANIGIPVVILFVWVWAIASSQASDWRSDESVYRQ